jgi:hypothetical protein
MPDDACDPKRVRHHRHLFSPLTLAVATQFITDGDLAICQHFCVDPHVDMAKGALEGGNDVEIALCGDGIDLGCRTPRDRRDHAQPRRSESEFRTDTAACRRNLTNTQLTVAIMASLRRPAISLHRSDSA